MTAAGGSGWVPSHPPPVDARCRPRGDQMKTHPALPPPLALHDDRSDRLGDLLARLVPGELIRSRRCLHAITIATPGVLHIKLIG